MNRRLMIGRRLPGFLTKRRELGFRRELGRVEFMQPSEGSRPSETAPIPNALFMRAVANELRATPMTVICDRDAKWSRAVRDQLARGGVMVVQTSIGAPNANAHAERFVRFDQRRVSRSDRAARRTPSTIGDR